MKNSKMTYREKARRCPIEDCDGEFIHQHASDDSGEYVNFMTCGHDLDDLCLIGNTLRERVAELEQKIAHTPNNQ